MVHDAHWDDLVGLQVRIQKDGRTVRIGQVEEVTPTADALWAPAHGIDSHALYEKAEGYRVLPVQPKPGRA